MAHCPRAKGLCTEIVAIVWLLTLNSLDFIIG